MKSKLNIFSNIYLKNFLNTALSKYETSIMDLENIKYDNKNINRMLDICNNQVFETYQELLLIAGKNLTKLYKEVKKNNLENNLDEFHYNSVLKQIIEK